MALQAAVFPGVGMAARPGPPAPKSYDIKANCQPADWYLWKQLLEQDGRYRRTGSLMISRFSGPQ